MLFIDVKRKDSNMFLQALSVHEGNTLDLGYDPDYVYSSGLFHDKSTLVLSRDRLSECMNFRIALDYWKHGQKIYTRD